LFTAPNAAGRFPAFLLPDLSLIFVALIWGASYAVAKETLALTTVVALIFFRFAIAVLVLLPTCIREIQKLKKDDMVRGVILGTILSCIFIAETVGVLLTSATNAAFLISLCILITPILDALVRGRAPSLLIVACAIVSLIGTFFMVGGLEGFSLNMGDIAILCAAGLRAVMVISTKRLLHGRDISSSALTTIQLGTVTLLSGFALFGTQGVQGFLPPMDVNFWVGLLFLSVFCTLAAFYIQNWAVRRTNPTRVSFLMGTEPIFGAAFAIWLLNEQLTSHSLLGAVLIFGATLVGTRLSRSTD